MEVKVMEEEEARGKQDVRWNLGKTGVQWCWSCYEVFPLPYFHALFIMP